MLSMSSAERSRSELLQILDKRYSPRVPFRRCRERVEKDMKRDGALCFFKEYSRKLTVGERGPRRKEGEDFRPFHFASAPLNGLREGCATIKPHVMPLSRPRSILGIRINTTRRRTIDTVLALASVPCPISITQSKTFPILLTP